MECERFKEIMHEYIDGELSEMDECLAAEHCAECESCAREARSFRRTRELTAQYGAEYAPTGLVIALKQKIDAEHRFSGWLRKSRAGKAGLKSNYPGPKWAALAATFTLVVLAGAYLNFFQFGGGGGLSSKFVVDQKSKSSSDIYKAKQKGPTAIDEIAGNVLDEKSTVGRGDMKPAVASAVAETAVSNGPGASALPERRAAGGVLNSTVIPHAPQAGEAAAHSGNGAGITAEAKAAELAIEQFDRKYETVSSREETGAAPKKPYYTSDVESEKRLGASETSVARTSSGGSAGKSAPTELVGYVEGRGERSYPVLSAQAPFATVIEPEDVHYVVFKEAPKAAAAPMPGKGKARGITVARATDVVTSKNPGVDALKCQKIILNFNKVNNGVTQWQRIGNRFVIRGPYKAMNPLRIKLAEEFTASDTKAKKDIKVASTAAPAAAAEDASKMAQDINPDMPAVLELLVIPDQAPAK